MRTLLNAKGTIRQNSPAGAPDPTDPARELTYRSRRGATCLAAVLFGLLELLAILPAAGATFVVTDLSNAGPGTLRDALNQAIANPGGDIIEFDSAISGTITLSAALPVMTGTDADGTEIRGETADDVGAGPDIAIDGASIGIDGLVMEDVFSCIVRGLRIIGCENGIVLRAQAGYIGNIVIGGTALQHRNVLTENGNGILIEGTLMQYNSVINTHAIRNDANGLVLQEGANAVTVGGNLPFEFNVFSGNGENGVLLYGAEDRDVHDNVIQYNKIGVDRTGTSAIPNVVDGIRCVHAGPGEIYGNVFALNLISGNRGDGISFINHVSNNDVNRNFIGTDISGASAIGNEGNGVHISAGAQYNRFGPNVTDPNVISGNDLNGVLIEGGFSDYNEVDSCFVGVDVTGSYAIGNGRNGVLIRQSPLVNFVRKCIISGNSENGVKITGGTATNTVSQCLIGTDGTGHTAIPNGTTSDHGGVRLDQATHHNVISGNLIAAHSVDGQFGIGLFGGDTSDNIIQVNTVGLDGSGMSSIPNSYGLLCGPGADGNTIWGNTVSGNLEHGLVIDGNDNTLTENKIGTDPSGIAGLGNGGSGIYLTGTGNMIGGLRSDGDGNLVSGNALWGIEAHQYGDSASQVTIQGNDIGVGATGEVLGNDFGGVWIGEYFSDCRIGDWPFGAGKDAANTIAYNGNSGSNPAGVRVGEEGAGLRGPHGVLILTNSIFANASEGIDIDAFDPDFGNSNITEPTVTGASPTFVEGDTNLLATPVPTVQVFYDNASQGRIFLGNATVSGTTWSLVPSDPIPEGSFATATNTALISGLEHTSEFSGPMEVTSLRGSYAFMALPEPLGGESHAYTATRVVTALTAEMIYVGGDARREPDADLLPCVWEGIGQEWTYEILSTPDPDMPGRVNDLHGGQQGEELVSAAGRILNLSQESQPIVWEKLGSDPWTYSLLPMPGGEGGTAEVTALAREGDGSESSAAGWSQQAGGAMQATLWERADDAGEWMMVDPLSLPMGWSPPGEVRDVAYADGGMKIACGYSYDAMDRIAPLYWEEMADDWIPKALPLPEDAIEAKTQGLSLPNWPGAEITVVGSVMLVGGETRAARWTSNDGGEAWQVSLMPAGMPACTLSGAVDVMEFPDWFIVGSSSNETVGRRAIIWAPHAAYDLNDHIGGDPPSLILEFASAIDMGRGNQKMIVGWGSRQDYAGAETGAHAYILEEEGSTNDVSETLPVGSRLQLRAAPNPVPEATTILLDLPRATDLDLFVTDIQGRRLSELLDGRQEAGRTIVDWNTRDRFGRKLPGGVYFLRLETETEARTWKLIVRR